MAMNRVQFQAGLSMAEFMDRYGSEEQCEAALAASRWPDGFRCPACGAAAHGTFFRGRRRYWQCAACRHQSSALCGTIFEATKLPLTRWFLAMHLLTQSKNNVSALELKRHLGVCYKSAWLMKHKLMEVVRLREDSRVLDGRVEIDDAYLGGERTGGKSGRGSENKVPFVAAVQTGGGKAAARLPQFKAVNTLLGNLKTALSGTYHAFNFAKHAHRYLAKVQYRFNRRFNLASILARLLHAAAITAPRPAPLIRLAEVCR